MTTDEKYALIAQFNPLRALELKKEAEERKQGGEKYTIIYDKTYSSGSTDTYETGILAHSLEEALSKAEEKLYLKDMMGRWDTDITDAVLIDPTGDRHLVPQYSRQWREQEEYRQKSLVKS